MICKKCGNNRFYAKQEVAYNCIVDEKGNWIEDIQDLSVYEQQSIIGPYECTECGEFYEVLE